MNKADEIVKFFEGCRLTAYKDSGGILTIGYGHTKHVHEGDIISQDTADNYLIEDLKLAECRVHRTVLIPLQDYELSALASQAYNLRSFEMLADHLQISGRKVYKDKSLLYCKDSKGVTYNGLLIRRICERLLFENRYWLDLAKQMQAKNDLAYTQSLIPKLFI